MAPLPAAIEVCMPPHIRPARTIAASLGGGVIGLLLLGAVMGYVIGPMLDLQGLATLLPPLLGGIVGAVLGASFGLAFAFRDEPRRRRLSTVLTVLLPASVLLAGAAAEVIDVMVVHPLTLAVLLPALALLGRFVGTRGNHDRDGAGPRRVPDGAARSR
jgi:peptidoglycan/LPS O-acetylase OafA/YrhL